MKKVIRLSEADITKLVKRVLEESHENYSDRYMFFSNLEQMRRQCDMLLELDQDMVTQILDDGHDWAQDHIAEAKNNMDQVFDFMMNHIKGDGQQDIEDASFTGMMEEGRKKTGTKLCARGKAAAKAKFKVYPSAYSNGYGVQVCKGRMPGLDGKKKCSPPYC
jgi:cell division GTPase FtsZ